MTYLSILLIEILKVRGRPFIRPICILRNFLTLLRTARYDIVFRPPLPGGEEAAELSSSIPKLINKRSLSQMMICYSKEKPLSMLLELKQPSSLNSEHGPITW